MTDHDILTDPQWVAFQAQLDAQPDSHDTRAVLADWLEGFGHPWARTYRWMARMRKYPMSRFGWYRHNASEAVIINAKLRFTEDREANHAILDYLNREEAEIRLCELFDELPLVGKEEFADV